MIKTNQQKICMENLSLFFKGSFTLSLVGCGSTEEKSLKKELKEQKKLAEVEFKKTYKQDPVFRPDSLSKINAQDNEERTPLNFVTKWGDIKIIKALLKLKVDPYILDNEGNTAIDLANSYLFRFI